MQKAMSNDAPAEKKGGVLKGVLGGVAAGIAVSAVSVVMMNNSKKTLQKKSREGRRRDGGSVRQRKGYVSVGSVVSGQWIVVSDYGKRFAF